MLSAIFLTLSLVSAQGAQVDPGPAIDPGALRVIGDDGRPGEACPLKGTQVAAKIEGFGARVIVVQTFTNPSAKPIEAVYTFPLPQDSAVDGMRMIIGDRIIEGVIKKKQEAKETYEKAKQEGKTAALLDQERPNVFTQSVANIPPGAEIQVALTYVQILKFEKDEFEFVYPMVVAHRFAGGTTPDPEKVVPKIVPEGTRSGSTISLKVELDAGAPIISMNSVLHKVETHREGTNRAIVKLAKADEIPNRDFILRYSIAGNNMVGAFLTHTDSKKGGFFTLIMMPPKVPSASQVAPKEAIFVMDQSGSQKDRPILKSKELTVKLIEALNPNDTFNVVSFADDYKVLWPRPRPNTAANRQAATKYVNTLEANGGTQLEKAVVAALSPKADADRPRIVIFNTDGLLGGEAKALEEIQRHRGNSRMFTFGIGNSVNRYLIEAMSIEGRGDHEIVTLDTDADAAVDRLVQRTDSPVLTDIRVKFEGVQVTDTLPRYIPDVFSEKPVIIKGRYRNPGKGFVTVRGNLGGKPWSARYPIDFPKAGSSGSAIGSLWAREKVNDLETQERIASTWSAQARTYDPKIWEDRITTLALDFAIMTRFTSFVAVDQNIVNPGGKQETIRVPVDMADGISYEGIFGGKKDVRLAKAPSRPAFRPGDPLLVVDAPKDANVVAVFPGGDLKPLAWNDQTRKWEVRFDIPISFAEGVYTVEVHILGADGKRVTLNVPFEVTLKTPDLAPKSSLLNDGSVRIELEGDPRWARLLLLPPWGERLEFAFDPQSGKIRLDLKLPADFKGGWFKLIGFDRAFSQSTARLFINSKGEIEKIELGP